MQINLNKDSCAKQVTVAIIMKDGMYWIGTNSCEKPQNKCPRGKLPSGVGYEKCKNICKQTGHAEENALKAAGKNAKGGDLLLLGHYYICDNCKKLMEKAGIRRTYIGIKDYFFQEKEIK